MKKNHISVIIPAYNESAGISFFIQHLSKVCGSKVIEVILVDGQSTDDTKQQFELLKLQLQTIKPEFAQKLRYILSEKGRAKQLNTGAAEASGNLLYFLHGDSFPPEAFDEEIIKAVDEGHPAGCFEMVFDSKHPWLQFLGFWTRFNHVSCRGGDQSQYITSELFNQIGGYDESFKIYEDYILIRELYARKKFHVIRKKLITSARKYKKYGVLRVQYCHLLIYFKRFCGADSEAIYNAYINCFSKR